MLRKRNVTSTNLGRRQPTLPLVGAFLFSKNFWASRFWLLSHIAVAGGGVIISFMQRPPHHSNNLVAIPISPSLPYTQSRFSHLHSINTYLNSDSSPLCLQYTKHEHRDKDHKIGLFVFRVVGGLSRPPPPPLHPPAGIPTISVGIKTIKTSCFLQNATC